MDITEQNYEDFISTVSHELRTPLTSIRGFSQTMLQSWDKIDDESKKKFLKIIEEQSNRLINLVENMLSVTKLQTAKDNFVYKETNLKPLIEQTISIVKNQYKNHNFVLDFHKNIPPIFTDRDKFQQIMTNLTENAAKYSCVWYFRRVVNDIGPETMQKYIDEYKYGNKDISDWEGTLNTNESNPDLIGFWIESSLKISPREQAEVMERIFGEDGYASEETIDRLKQVMLLQEEDGLSIYGKTGMG